MPEELTPLPAGDEPLAFETQKTASAWNQLDATAWSAAAALVFATVAYHLSSRQSELTSELLCWVFLPIIFIISKQYRNADTRTGALPAVNALAEPAVNSTYSSSSLWLVALCISLCTAFKAEKGTIILFPVLVPLLTLGQRYLKPGLYPATVSHMSLFPLLAYNPLGTAVVAIVAIAALSEWDPLSYSISVVPVFALFFVYTLLTPQNQTAHRSSRWIQSFDFEAAVLPLSLRVAGILGLLFGREWYLLGFPSGSIIDMVVSGVAKAAAWYFASQLAHHTSWLTAVVASTFGLLASQNPFAQQTDARALLAVIASLVSLGQSVYLLPKQTKGKLVLWILALIPVIPYFANLAAIQYAQSSVLVHVENHPVEVLIREAKANFGILLQNQSSTYAQAYDEYQRRYGFEPPHGFEDWYKFAKSHDSPIIDEFDIISEGIAPFLRLSGEEVLRMITQAYDEPDHELWRCSTFGQPAKTQCSHHGRENDRNNAHFFNRMTSRIPVELNLKFLMNHLDEPTVVLPPPYDSEQGSGGLNITNLGGQRVWEAITQHCLSRKPKPAPQRQEPVETYGLPFVTDRVAAMDICQHAEYNDIHGLFVAPESLRLTEGLVPILSNGAPSSMGDILYPSTAYIEEDRFAYHEDHDMDWDKKQNNLYWAGSTTGGHAREGNWQNLHRQRFVAFAQNLQPSRWRQQSSSSSYSYLRENAQTGAVSRVRSSFLNSRLYDVAFTNVLQCDPRACRDQRRHFRNKAWAPADAPLGSRLVFDLDGNGISGRYYKLLESRSAPLKQSLVREWHDDRLVPWLHFVPVSQDMGELPELVEYLTSSESGRARAKEIADAGRRWFQQAFREVDVVIYMYRLMLELSRLQDPDRPASQIPVQ